MRKNLLSIVSFLVFTVSSYGNISVGDIVIIGFNGDGGGSLDKDFAVVTLANIPVGEVIYFTDRGISAGNFNNSFTSEGTITYTVTTTIPAGTVIKFNVYAGATPSAVATPGSYGTTSVTGWTVTVPGNGPWGGSGDQMLIYQAGPTFIFGFNNSLVATGLVNGWHTGTSTSINFSNIPPGLTNGVNAIAFAGGAHIDNLIYSGPKTGSKASLLAAITNTGNWAADDVNAYDLAAGGANFTGPNPIFGGAILPVHLISFQANKSGNAHELTWNVKNEESFNYYQVEASDDGRTFHSIARINAAGHEQYRYNNNNILSSRNYYRLKMVNADGGFIYSNVVLLVENDDKNSVLVYPNPVSTVVNVSSRNRITKVIITEATGRQVLQQSVNQNTVEIDLQTLKAGLYHLIIHTVSGKSVHLVSKAQ
jgi:hypothetical protein